MQVNVKQGLLEFAGFVHDDKVSTFLASSLMGLLGGI